MTKTDLYQTTEDCDRIESSELALLDAELEATGALVEALAAPVRTIVGYKLTVYRGAKAGTERMYGPSARRAASAAADKLDREYGAMCSAVQPVWGVK